MKLEQTVWGYPIRVEAVRLDEGWDIGVFGGCRTHVGAVTLAAPGQPEETLERPGHRDSVVSSRWARVLAEALQAPVCVRCGIHFDLIAKDQIGEILACCDGLLEQLKAWAEKQLRESGQTGV